MDLWEPAHNKRHGIEQVFKTFPHIEPASSKHIGHGGAEVGATTASPKPFQIDASAHNIYLFSRKSIRPQLNGHTMRHNGSPLGTSKDLSLDRRTYQSLRPKEQRAER
jgi:hypothetical protein